MGRLTEQTEQPEQPAGTDRCADSATIRVLHELYEPLRRFAAVVGRWDVEPDDLVQEAYARFLRLEPGAVRDLGPYLRRVIANAAIDERRRVRRAEAARLRLVGDGNATDSYPSELADLLQLDPRARGLLYLVEIEGEPIGEAARAVGMGAAAARMALTRARRQLRAVLESEREDD